MRPVIACMLNNTVSHIQNCPGECAEGEKGGEKVGEEQLSSSPRAERICVAWTR